MRQPDQARTQLFDLGLPTGASSLLAKLATPAPLFAGDWSCYGAGAWRRGRLYFAAFPNPPTDAVHLTAIDPGRLKRALAARWSEPARRPPVAR